MNNLLEKLFNHQNLNRREAAELLEKIVSGEANKSQVVAAISCILMRTVSEQEILGFRHVLLEQALNPGLYTDEAIDVCGTGGDGKNTFNISTLSAIVIAGAGYKVIKHGNYGASSVCGSSNLLDRMGYSFSTDTNKLNRQLDESNLVFLHAPLSCTTAISTKRGV
jgi:anthranilate phosphoribosyltransferase